MNSMVKVPKLLNMPTPQSLHKTDIKGCLMTFKEDEVSNYR